MADQAALFQLLHIHTEAWQAIQRYVSGSTAERIVLPAVYQDFIIALGRYAEVSSTDSSRGYPYLKSWEVLANVYKTAEADRLVYVTATRALELYRADFLLATEIELDITRIIAWLQQQDTMPSQGHRSLCETVALYAQRAGEYASTSSAIGTGIGPLAKLPMHAATPVAYPDAILRFLDALGAHRRVWSSLMYHVAYPSGPLEVPVRIPTHYVDFIVEVGRALVARGNRVVHYPDAMLMSTYFHLVERGAAVALTYHTPTRMMQLVISKDDQPDEVSHTAFTFENVLTMLDGFKLDVSADTQAVITQTHEAALVCLAGEPEVNLARQAVPQTREAALEMTQALWRSWGFGEVDITVVDQAVATDRPVSEADRLLAMVENQRRMLENLGEQISQSSSVVVPLPAAYAKFLTTTAALYKVWSSGPGDVTCSFGDLHLSFYQELVQTESDWEVHYNQVSSMLKISTVAYNYVKQATDRYKPLDGGKAGYVQHEPLSTKDSDTPHWPVRITVAAPWDFQIELLMLNRLEKALNDSDALDLTTLQVLEALDPLVQDCLKSHQKGH